MFCFVFLLHPRRAFSESERDNAFLEIVFGSGSDETEREMPPRARKSDGGWVGS